MKIQVKQIKNSANEGKVFVYRFKGEKQINEMFGKINQRIKIIKEELRALAWVKLKNM